VVERIVDGIVARILRPFRRSKQADDIATDAITSLPFGAKGWSTLTTWEIEAKAAAREAALTLGDAATSSEMKVVARQAVAKIGARFADGELREQVVRWASMPWSLTDSEK